MSPYQLPTCVYCRENLPHARHITALEFAKLFTEEPTHAATVKSRLLGRVERESLAKSA